MEKLEGRVQWPQAGFALPAFQALAVSECALLCWQALVVLVHRAYEKSQVSSAALGTNNLFVQELDVRQADHRPCAGFVNNGFSKNHPILGTGWASS